MASAPTTIDEVHLRGTAWPARKLAGLFLLQCSNFVLVHRANRVIILSRLNSARDEVDTVAQAGRDDNPSKVGNMRTSFQALSMGLLLLNSPALAQDEPSDFTVSGSVVLASDYRFRGVSQSDKDPTIQGSIQITHTSGLYIGTFASSLAGWGTFGGPNIESDVFGGYKFQATEHVSIDVGLTWYMYAGGASITDFAEPYVKVSGSVGPASLTAGVAYAPKQEALGRWYRTAAEFNAGTPSAPGKKNDNLYIWGDVGVPIKSTPFTLKGHIGYSDGNPGLGPNGTSIAPTGKFADWMVGVDTTWKNLTLGVAYIDTSISRSDRLPLAPNFGTSATGASISDPTFVVSLTAAF